MVSQYDNVTVILGSPSMLLWPYLDTLFLNHSESSFL